MGKLKSAMLTKTITPVLTSGNKTNRDRIDDDEDEDSFSDSEQPSSLDNELIQLFGTQHTPSNALALTHVTGDMSHLGEKDHNIARASSCQHCELEKRKRSITQDAF